MMRKEDWASYKPVTEFYAVGRWGKIWRVIDRTSPETGYNEVGPPFDRRYQAVEYAEYRQSWDAPR